MSWFISICEDMTALKATGAVDEASPYRGMIDGRSGAHVQYNGNKSAIILTSIEGLELLEQLPFITVTTPEDVFGYRRQVEIDGVPQWDTPTTDEEGNEVQVPLMEEVPGNAAMLAKYLDVYDYLTPVDDGEGGTYMRPKMFAVPGGYPTDHLL